MYSAQELCIYGGWRRLDQTTAANINVNNKGRISVIHLQAMQRTSWWWANNCWAPIWTRRTWPYLPWCCDRLYTVQDMVHHIMIRDRYIMCVCRERYVYLWLMRNKPAGLINVIVTGSGLRAGVDDTLLYQRFPVYTKWFRSRVCILIMTLIYQ